MKRGALIVALLLAPAACRQTANVPWIGNAPYQIPITIDGGNVSGTHADFPVVVEVTDGALRSEGNGGHVQDALGADIFFVVGETMTTAFEITEYDAGTGTLRAWVRLPVLEAGVDPRLSVHYGDVASAPVADPGSVWINGFEAVYHFNGTARDSTAFARDGTQNGTTDTNGRLGTALSFDGSSSISVADVVNLDAGTECTVIAWVDPEGTIPEPAVLIGKTTATEPGYSTVISPTRQPGFRISDGTDTFELLADSGTGANYDHLAVVWDPADEASTRIYIDGSLATSTPLGVHGEVDSAANSSVLTIGSTSSGGGGFYNGRLDELSIASVARSQGWVETVQANQVNPTSFAVPGSEIAR